MAKFKYAVFVSHNRVDKPLVRQIVAQWREVLGLRVFFDEDSVKPGENVVRAIENGLSQSRRVVLILSRAAVESEWMALETAIAIHADPDGQNNRIIPVKIDDLPLQDIRASLRILNIIDLSDPMHREDRYQFLLTSFNIRGVDLPSCPWDEGRETNEIPGSEIPAKADINNEPPVPADEIHITFRGYEQFAFAKREMVLQAIDQLLRTGAKVVISHEKPSTQ